MPSVVISSSVSTPWRDGAALSALFGLVWRDGTGISTTGSPFVAPPAPPGSTPTAPSLAATYVLPAADAYNVVHDVVCTDLRDNAALKFDTMSFGTDDGSVCWTLNATGPSALFARFATGGAAPVLKIVVDGLEWQFLVEGVRRTRSFASTGVSLTGRSLTIGAGEPYEFQQNWINQGPATAAQLVEQANLYTGLIVDWQLDDWLVPDKVWSFSGTPLAVAQRVAESVSAVVRSERAEMRLAIMPRYPLLPNEWPTVAPDVEIHIDGSMTDSYERADKPAYNGVYVSGQQQGVVGYITLAGTAGDLVAPLVTDLLLTDIDGVRQRGMAILGAAGPQARVQMTLPVLTGAGEPGVLDLGQLCRVIGDGSTWWAIVRAVGVNVVLPSVMQTVVLERHSTPSAAPAAPAPPAAPFFHASFTGSAGVDLTTYAPDTGSAFAGDQGAALSTLRLDGAGKLTGVSSGFHYVGIYNVPSAGNWFMQALVTITVNGNFGLVVSHSTTDVGAGTAGYAELDILGGGAAPTYDLYGDDGAGPQDFPGATAAAFGSEFTLRMEVTGGNKIVTAKINGATLATMTFATAIAANRLGFYFDDGSVNGAVLVNEITAGAL